MHNVIRTIGAKDILKDKLEDNMFVGSMFLEDLLVSRLRTSKAKKESYNEKMLENRFGILPK